MKADIAALAYLISGVLFILALQGLSSPASSRAGNRNGIVGMAIAVATTLWVAEVSEPLTWIFIIGGIATSYGVESTAREAWQHNYSVVVAEDACSSMDAEMHRFSMEKIFPRLARVRTTDANLEALPASLHCRPKP